MLEKWKSAVDKGKLFSALLTDICKAFDCLSHYHLLAKLHAYGFSFSALKLIHSYLKNGKRELKSHAYGFSFSALKFIHSYLKFGKQRTKIDSTYGSWEEIHFYHKGLS